MEAASKFSRESFLPSFFPFFSESLLMWQEQWESLLEKPTLIPSMFTMDGTGPEPQKIFL